MTEQLLDLIRLTPEAELPQRLAELGPGAVLDDVLALLTSRFAGSERRDPGTLALELDHSGTSYARALVVDTDGARAGGVSPSAPAPRATVRTSLVRFLRVAAGAQRPARLVLARRMTVSGDLTWAIATVGALTK